MSRRGFLLSAGLLLVLLPAAARAEVSVLVDAKGRVKRVVYVTRDTGRSAVVWKQVRPRVPFESLLNPLGDTTGDLPPSIAIHPQTGRPWVVWPRNEGNQKRLVYSTWDGKAWTLPQRVAAPDIMGWDQIEPRLLFDPAGTPYLVFTEAARNGRILFSTVARGVWTPTLPLSDGTIDSRSPGAAVLGDDLKVTWSTPTGVVTKTLPTTALVERATSLMDSPIPPGSNPKPDDPEPPGGDEPDDKFRFPH
jgi:hypothetical protein